MEKRPSRYQDRKAGPDNSRSDASGIKGLDVCRAVRRDRVTGHSHHHADGERHGLDKVIGLEIERMII